MASERIMNRNAYRQRGISLIVTLIAMIAILLIGVAMIRVVDFSGVLTRNLAFREGSIHVADIGIQYGLTALGQKTSLDITNIDTCTANSVDYSNCYYPVNMDTKKSDGTAYSSTDTADGIPDDINWNSVTPINLANADGYTVRFIIERLCNKPLGTAVTDIAADCQTAVSGGTVRGGSSKIGSPVFSGTSSMPYYRITSMATSQNGNKSIVQALVYR